MSYYKVKGTAILVQAWRGSGGSGRLRRPDSKKIGTRRWRVVSPTHQPPKHPLSEDTFLALIYVKD
jgi:hypothetical protein